MKKHWWINALVILTSLLPAAYLAIIWDSLPPQVALHFDINMKPDRMGEKAEMWVPVLLLAGVSVGIYFLMNNLHRFDPKRRNASASGTFSKLGTGLVFFMTALNFLIVSSAKGNETMQHFLFPLLGLLFAFLGNYMHHIRPNYFAGIRLPWTLNDDENWRKTHQLAGKLWFAAGLLLAVISLFLAPPVLLPFFLGLIVVLVLVPTVYSYLLYKRKVS